ncbi:hypothetical protein [Streptomyces mutabilis]|uniref:hypothetical protein n=1 Tax=Streptomyces mutabilis TaxID=67332 RepID=UPI000AF54FAF
MAARIECPALRIAGTVMTLPPTPRKAATAPTGAPTAARRGRRDLVQEQVRDAALPAGDVVVGLELDLREQFAQQLCRACLAAPDTGVTNAAWAARTAMSERSFTRRFRAQAGDSPAV